MAEDRNELLQHYRTMRQATQKALAGLSDEQLTDPSLDGWSVKDHLAHLATWDEIRASEIHRISAGYSTLWKTSGGQDDAINAISYELRRDISLEQAIWEFEITHDQLLAAIADATADGLDGSRYGEAGLRTTHEAEHAEWITEWRATKGF